MVSRASAIIWAIGKTIISLTPLRLLESLGLYISSDQFVILPLYGYYCIFLTFFSLILVFVLHLRRRKRSTLIFSTCCLRNNWTSECHFLLLISESTISIPVVQLYRRTLEGEAPLWTLDLELLQEGLRTLQVNRFHATSFSQFDFSKLLISILLTFFFNILANPMGHYSSSLDQVVRGGTPQGSSSLPTSQPHLVSQSICPSRTIVAVATPFPPSGQSVRASEE